MAASAPATTMPFLRSSITLPVTHDDLANDEPAFVASSLAAASPSTATLNATAPSFALTSSSSAASVTSSSSSTTTSSASSAAAAAFQLQQRSSTSSVSSADSSSMAFLAGDNKKTVSSPQDFFTDMLRSRGYPATTFCSLKCGYHNSPTKHQTASYGISLTRAIRSSDAVTARSLLASGLHPNACNKFGESIVHAACRRGDYAMLRELVLGAGSSVQVTDDFGRTPLHDACWTTAPNFDAIRLLLDQDPWLLSIMDCRGSTPLGYVRKAHWALWIGFLGAIANRYWPDLLASRIGGNSGGEQQERPSVPPLAFAQPNSRPAPDPKRVVLDLDVVELLANGKLAPRDVLNDEKKDGRCCSKGTAEASSAVIAPEAIKVTTDGIPAPSSFRPASRITLDPLRASGSNATTMLKGGPHSHQQRGEAAGGAASSPATASFARSYVHVFSSI